VQPLLEHIQNPLQEGLVDLHLLRRWRHRPHSPDPH
jgi:hypothetical protein